MSFYNGDRASSEYNSDAFSTHPMTSAMNSSFFVAVQPSLKPTCEEEGFYEVAADNDCPSTPAPPLNGFEGFNLYVASLPYDFTDAELYALFAPFGSILSAKAMCKRSSAKENKGFGFVLFEKEEDALHAQRVMIGHVVRGSKIQVRQAKGTPCFSSMSRLSSARSQEKVPLPEFSTGPVTVLQTQSTPMLTTSTTSAPSFFFSDAENRPEPDSFPLSTKSVSPAPFTIVPSTVAMPTVMRPSVGAPEFALVAAPSEVPFVVMPSNHVIYGNFVSPSSTGIYFPCVGSESNPVGMQQVQFFSAAPW